MSEFQFQTLILVECFLFLFVLYQGLLRLHHNTIKERKPGEQILENINDITVVCKRGWA